LKTVGISDEVKDTAIAVKDEIMRLTGSDIPDKHIQAQESDNGLMRAIVKETVEQIYKRRKINA
jgi:hypothetical protein